MALQEELIDILSRHRAEADRYRPRPVPLRSLCLLLQLERGPGRKPPQEEEIHDALKELVARGEVTNGPRQCFSAARPAVVFDGEGFGEARFLGDRAYLAAVHRQLETDQEVSEPRIRSRLPPVRARERLDNIGVPLQSWSELIEVLPQPELPTDLALRDGHWDHDPFHLFDRIAQYVPTIGATQVKRWIDLHPREKPRSALLQLPDRTLLWQVQMKYFCLGQETALLAMFELDRLACCPLSVPWHESSGTLDLQKVVLPAAHARLLWALSDHHPELWRTRVVRPRNRALVRAILNSLGLIA